MPANSKEVYHLWAATAFVVILTAIVPNFYVVGLPFTIGGILHMNAALQPWRPDKG